MFVQKYEVFRYPPKKKWKKFVYIEKIPTFAQ